MRYEIKSRLYSNGNLEMATVLHDDIHKTSEIVAKSVANLKEQAVREALIKLGWTPPIESTKE